MTLTPEQEALVHRAKAVTSPFDIGSCLGRGWDLLKTDFWGVLGGLLVLLVIVTGLSVLSLIPLVGLLINVLVAPALSLGAVSWFLARARKEPAPLGIIFSGFSRFGEALALYLVMGVLVLVGLLFCILPGIYLAIAWGASWPLLADRRGGFWECMEMSRRAITAHFGWALLLYLVLVLVSIAGILACGLGLIVTVPLAYLAGAAAYLRLFDSEETLVSPPDQPSHPLFKS
jgi:uncharacterized membrane protein